MPAGSPWSGRGERAREPAAGPHPRAGRAVRRCARVGAGRAARCLRHDRSVATSRRWPREAWWSGSTAGSPRSSGRSTDEPGFTAKSSLQTEEKRGHRAGGRPAGRTWCGGGDLGRHHHVRGGAASCATSPDLTVVTNSIPVAQLLHESGRVRPDGRADRRYADAVRRAGRPGGGRVPAHACTSTGCSSACTASTSGPGSRPPTWSRPRRTGPCWPRPVAASSSPTTRSGGWSASARSRVSTRSTSWSRTRRCPRPARRGAAEPRRPA